MEIKQLLRRIRKEGIDISLQGEHLQLHNNAPIPDELIAEIKSNKKDILNYLKAVATTNGDSDNRIPKATSTDGYVLSSAQLQLWALSQNEGRSIAYNLHAAYVVDGDLNVEALAYAFKQLMDRHEVLRTVFRKNEQGEIRQFILNTADVFTAIPHQDIRGVDQIEHWLKKAIEQEFSTLFDLANGPLLRPAVFQLDESKWVLSLTSHHIVSDGWSLPILFGELFHFYNNYTHKQPTALPPLPIQYKDYASWQIKQLEKGNVHKAFWLEQFDGELPVLELPKDKVRPAVRSYDGRMIEFAIEDELASQLYTACKQWGGTLFMGIMTTMKALFYHYTNQEDIIVGYPIAGRNHSDVENLIGFFVNTLPLRTKFKGEDSFHRLFDKVKKGVLEANEHQIYPFEEIIKDLGVSWDKSHNPLYDVMVKLQNTNVMPQEGHASVNMNIDQFGGYESTTSELDLLFNFIEGASGIYGSVSYSTDIYHSATVERLVHNFLELLKNAIQNPSLPIKELDILSEQEQDKLLGFGQGLTCNLPADNVIALFEAQVQKTPDKPAVVFNGSTLSYAELDSKSNQLANYLVEACGVQQGRIVGIQLARSDFYIISLLGVLKTGAAFALIDPDYPVERIEAIINGAEIATIVTSTEYLLQLDFFQGIPIAIDVQLDVFPDSTNFNPKPSNGKDLAYVIYTSGSTGEPKGVMVENKSLVNLCHWHTNYYSINSKDRTTFYSSVAFDAVVWEIFPYLVVGATIYIIPNNLRLEIGNLNHFIEQNQISVSFLPTPIGEKFMEEDNTSLRLLHLGGDKMSVYHKTNYQIYNNFGPTENTVVATAYKVQENSAAIPIGKPVYNTNIYILNNQKKLCPIGVPGEIYISGASLARGYINDEVLTAEKFMDNPFLPSTKMYKTGDLGKWLPDGNIQFIGRNDGQVKVRGYRIELGEVETALRNHGAVRHAAVLVKKNIKWSNGVGGLFSG